MKLRLGQRAGRLVQEIRSEVSGNAQSAGLLELVIRESDRINAIVSDFLHFSRMRRTALTRTDLAGILDLTRWQRLRRIELPAALVPRKHVFEIDERIDHAGEVAVPLAGL